MTFIWTFILVASIIVEAITVDLVSIWFAVGAGIALLSHVLLHVSTTIQVILFIFISVICIILSRPLAKKYLRGNTIKTNYDRIIGKHCLVKKTITPDIKGEVEVMSSIWSATSLNNETIEEGSYGEVVAIEGAHVIIKKI